MDDLGADDPMSEYIHLGSLFFAIAIVVWTTVAMWLSHSTCPINSPGAKGDSVDTRVISDCAVGKVENSLTEMWTDVTKGNDRKLVQEQLEGILQSEKINWPRCLLKGTSDEADVPGFDKARSNKEVLEDFLMQLLNSPLVPNKENSNENGDDKLRAAAAAIRSVREKNHLAENAAADNEGRSVTMAAMAEQAREIGNKYLHDKQFAGACHCYEVACFLGHAGGNSPTRVAAFHCNCALACLELGYYGDAINESNAALAMTPPRHVAVKAFYRLAVANANLNNLSESRRCLQRCLDIDPSNEYARAFLNRLEGAEGTSTPEEFEGRFMWVDVAKRMHYLGSMARDRARGKKTKVKSGSADLQSLTLDREAGIWHSVACHKNKLYILGGLPDNPQSSPSTTPLDATTRRESMVDSMPFAFGAWAHPRGAFRSSDELHVLDLDSFELRRLSGPNARPPHPCRGHTATMVNSNMVVFGGFGPSAEQPSALMIFDLVQGKWKVPTVSGAPPRHRHGHTANAIQGNRYLCVFGGVEPTGEPKVARIHSEVFYLDLESYAWRQQEVGGRRLPARFGHTSTNLPTNINKLLVLGGRDTLVESYAVSLNDVQILDTDRRVWLQQPYHGSPPEKMFYHTATVFDERILLVVGSGVKLDTVPVHVLDLETWHWNAPAVSGRGPSPRICHTVAAMGNKLYLFGGVSRQTHVAADKQLQDVFAVDKQLYTLEYSDCPKETSGCLKLEEKDYPEEKDCGKDSGSAACEKDSGLDDSVFDDGDEPELSFEELLAQEKAFFKTQREKLSFPRAKD